MIKISPQHSQCAAIVVSGGSISIVVAIVDAVIDLAVVAVFPDAVVGTIFYFLGPVLLLMLSLSKLLEMACLSRVRAVEP